jgi:cephalosporin hydroxylase
LIQPRLSVVVVAYNMRRELPRTVRSLSAAMQVGVNSATYEIIVVDNGSCCACQEKDFAGSAPSPRLLRVESANASPARAANLGIGAARGDLVGVFIDGARMASPGLLAGAVQASLLHPRAVIATLGFHLGSEVQMESVRRGYCREVEDRLLEEVAWEADGYRLFGISAFAGSSAGGWFAPISESNGIFMSRNLWAELGGFDERFIQPGGGFVNLDLYRRACLANDVQLVVLLGEGTFHQVHGGAATNALVSPSKQFRDEYVSLRGESFSPPRVEPLFLGHVRKPVLPSIALSTRHERAATWAPPAAAQESLAVSEREWLDACALSGPALSSIQQAVLRTRYRGRLFLKSPFDIAIYLQLIQRLRPRAVIEIGAKEGGSAQWFADTLQNHGIESRILSVDLVLPTLIDQRIEFIAGDARNLAAVLPDATMRSLAHPILVVEDSAHHHATCLAVLEFFHPYLGEGDYIVIEDGVVRFFPEAQYKHYEDGPLRALQDFLKTHDGYAIDRSLCDMFGANVTYNPNGYLRRTGN